MSSAASTLSILGDSTMNTKAKTVIVLALRTTMAQRSQTLKPLIPNGKKLTTEAFGCGWEDGLVHKMSELM